MSRVLCQGCSWYGYSDELKSLQSVAGPSLINTSVDTSHCLCPLCGDYHIRHSPAGENKGCAIIQQQDEYSCSTCAMRWGVGEKAPQCERGVLKKRIMEIEMTGSIIGREKAEYRRLKDKLRELVK